MVEGMDQRSCLISPIYTQEEIRKVSSLMELYRYSYFTWKKDTLYWGSDDFIKDVLESQSVSNIAKIEEYGRSFSRWLQATGSGVANSWGPVLCTAMSRTLAETSCLLSRTKNLESELLRLIRETMSQFKPGFDEIE
jgi:hypothetical protein